MNYLGWEFKDEIITQNPGEGVNIRDCVFYNCRFEINKPSFVYLSNNEYHNCTFNFDLTGCEGDITIINDRVVE